VAGYDLGGSSQQLAGLSPDEMQRALAAVDTGGRYEPLPVQQAAPVPAPAPMPTAPPPPGPEQMPEIQRSTAARPAQAIREYQDQDLADANKRAALVDESGQKTVAEHAKKAEIRQDQQAHAKSEYERADADAQESRKQRKLDEARARKVLDEMEAHKRPPDRSTSETVMGVIGSILALGGNGGAAQGAAMIGKMLAPDREQWAAEQQANSNLYQALTRGVDMNNATESHVIDVGAKMVALRAHEINAAIDVATEQGMGEQGKLAAEQLKLDVYQQTRDRLVKLEQAKQAAQQKAAAGAGSLRERQLRERFWAKSEPELAAMSDADLGEVGQKVLAEKTKLRQAGVSGDLGIANQLAPKGDGKEAPLQAGAKTPTGRTVADPDVYNQLSTAERKTLADTDRVARDLSAGIDELLALRDEHYVAVGLPGTNANKRANAIGASIKLAVKDAKELGTLDKGSVEFLEEMVGDPTAWLINTPDEKIRSIKETTQRDADSLAKASGLAGRSGAPPKRENDPRVRKGFAAPSAASRGVSAGLPQSSVSLDDVRAVAQKQDSEDAVSDAAQAQLAAWMRK
jgi:hypothetical protein